MNVIHGQAVGSSDPEQTNAVCGPQGGESGFYKDEIQSVVIIKAPKGTKDIKGINHPNGFIGSGVIVKNTKNDGEMYLLTAFHLMPAIRSKFSEYKFIFGHESPVCDKANQTLPKNGTTIIEGASFVAGQSSEALNKDPMIESDILLLKLNHKLNSDDYKLFYSGWTIKDDAIIADGVVIHHPFV